MDMKMAVNVRQRIQISEAQFLSHIVSQCGQGFHRLDKVDN